MPVATMKSHGLRSSIGFTSVVELRKLNPNPAVRLLAKLEGNNPGGSVKDRPALFMIEGAEKRGDLTPDKTILEPTSGNTGIAFAMLGAARGYRIKLVMPACVSMERRAAVAGAIRLARRLSSGTIVALLPDRGDRYLSTSLFRSTCGACPP